MVALSVKKVPIRKSVRFGFPRSPMSLLGQSIFRSGSPANLPALWSWFYHLPHESCPVINHLTMRRILPLRHTAISITEIHLPRSSIRNARTKPTISYSPSKVPWVSIWNGGLCGKRVPLSVGQPWSNYVIARLFCLSISAI
ncbi:hypothetical protein M404DRAFT_838823 [Pisolithus tinctorius Marx 270]|uniref:Uncharacterized protein n=1 Tax=Pisolithus tinctorius Marx 270 TaxID=870435 RepID=A0A0C3PQI3_PISTI|nr:hypothetical protein M404DRAFT_838823 [Pisolithus tinctorius Marx 270]